MSPSQTAPVCLIDASIYIFQYYFSLPPNWSARCGHSTEAVYGFATFLLKLRQHSAPARAAACFDESLGSSFREQIYPGYKASRALPDEALAFQLQSCRELAELMGLACFASEQYEADDLIGSLMARLKRSKAPVAILSRDKDLGQLIGREQDFLWDYAKDQRYYRAGIEAKWGVPPELLADYLALVGDSIDDIPGVPGIGAKSAAAILQHYPGIEAVYANLDQLAELPLRGAGGLAAKLEDHLEQVALAKTLATIVTDLALVNTLNELNWGRADLDGLADFCDDRGFPRLFSRMEKVLA